MTDIQTSNMVLTGDLKYMLSKDEKVVYKGSCFGASIPRGKIYLVYPSIKSPRFIVPRFDYTAQRFILTMMGGDKGIWGLILHFVFSVPGILILFRALLFRQCIVIAKI